MAGLIYYIHDPMCSWCWGFSASYDNFIQKLDKQIVVKRLLGGLAADNNKPMDEATKIMVQNAWHKIEQTIPAIKFNFDYWDKNIARRSTYPACRAVIAAREQGESFDLKMTKAIQTAYYHHALNPSDLSTLSELAIKIGLDIDLFISDINSARINDILLAEIEQVRSLKSRSLPSLVLQYEQTFWPIAIDYIETQTMIDKVNNLLTSRKPDSFE